MRAGQNGGTQPPVVVGIATVHVAPRASHAGLAGGGRLHHKRRLIVGGADGARRSARSLRGRRAKLPELRRLRAPRRHPSANALRCSDTAVLKPESRASQ
jgi:hypothetical protein